ncbi:DUF2076 domain-containing protein [Methylolobus aquaticus]
MNSQERQALSRFLEQLTEVRLTDKDRDADSLIREATAQQPDAAYLLVQRAMLVEQALDAAKARITELERARRAGPVASEDSFLGGRNPWAPQAEPASDRAAVPGAGHYRVPSSGPVGVTASPMAGGGSFLGNVATTAAGVVAGSFLFQGLEGLLGHHHGMGSSWLDRTGEQLTEQTVINNYYGTDSSEFADSQQSEPEASQFFANDTDDPYMDDGASDSDWI